MTRDPDPDEKDIASLEDFSKRLDAVRSIEPDGSKTSNGSNISISGDLGRGMRIASELVAALLVGAAIGWGMDWYFGTGPWILLVGVGFGFAAGLVNVNRAIAEIDRAEQETAELEKTERNKAQRRR